MKKLILIMVLLTAGMFAQESNIELLYRGSTFQEDGGNLYALGGVGLYESGGMALKINPPAPYTLTQAGATIQAILDGTWATDIQLNTTKKLIFDGAGDDDTYLYESAEDVFRVYVGGVNIATITAAYFQTSSGARLGATAPTSTVASILPKGNGDGDTGLGWAASDTLALIAGGINIMNIGDEGVVVNEAGADLDFRAESAGEDSAFVVDGADGRIFTETGLMVRTGLLGTAHTLGADSCYGMVLYVTAAVTITLPAIAEGMSITFITIGANAVVIEPGSGEQMYLDGTLLDADDSATNNSTAGDMIVFTYYGAGDWYAASDGWQDLD